MLSFIQIQQGAFDTNVSNRIEREFKSLKAQKTHSSYNKFELLY